MKVYLAGPMRGYLRFNFDAFAEARQALRDMGYEVLCPAENDLAVGFDPDGPLEALDLHAAFRWDIAAILGVDGMVLLPGWEHSEGACLEVRIARAIGLTALPLDDVLHPTITPSPRRRHRSPTTKGAA